jgi:hypothetical protein
MQVEVQIDLCVRRCRSMLGRHLREKTADNNSVSGQGEAEVRISSSGNEAFIPYRGFHLSSKWYKNQLNIYKCEVEVRFERRLSGWIPYSNFKMR